MVVFLSLILLSLSALVQASTYKAADISSIVVVENAGHRYTDSGKVTPFETIIKNHGANTARIRVWTAGQYDLNYGLALAKRVKAAGLTLVIDLHYSDTCQFVFWPQVFESSHNECTLTRGRSWSPSYSFWMAHEPRWTEH